MVKADDFLVGSNILYGNVIDWGTLAVGFSLGLRTVSTQIYVQYISLWFLYLGGEAESSLVIMPFFYFFDSGIM